MVFPFSNSAARIYHSRAVSKYRLWGNERRFLSYRTVSTPVLYLLLKELLVCMFN